MRVFKWTPTFTPTQESSVVPIWVSFPELPAHLFRKDALFSVASMIGSPLQVDTLTLNKSKLSQARVCVEIDLLKPINEELDLLVNGVTIVQKVIFEQLPEYCSLCKHVGHKDVNCFSKGNAPRPPPRSNLYPRQRQVAGTGMKQTRDKGKKVFEQVNRTERNSAPFTSEKAECSKANQNGDDNRDGNERKCNNSGNDNPEMNFEKNRVANVDENERECDNCFDLVPFSPNPFVVLSDNYIDANDYDVLGDNVTINDMTCTTRKDKTDQLQRCTLNRVADEYLSPPENFYDFDTELANELENDLVEHGSDDSCEQRESGSESPNSSFEDGAIRGKIDDANVYVNVVDNITDDTGNENLHGDGVGNVEHALVEHAIVENDDENGVLTVEVNQNDAENDAIIDDETCGLEIENLVYTIENEKENGDGVEGVGKNEPHNDGFFSLGALILRPDKFACDLMKRTLWMKIDSALRLFETVKQFGVVMKGIEEDVEEVIKRNQLAVRSGILYQKCILIFDRVSQLYLKPHDERSPPIATRTRRRKKGKNPLEPPDDIHYF
ncbi:UNVERIFIED_CONTAM: hypothetical protein Sradi_7230000 [Sesamum radiatum]|uniref:DUF4283 domain-containing protein n=1 Tax=Sesamum radiatum TaxID=300843 RepID=A0AAW2IN54_SESRA